jgi:hypothetical protein
LTARIIGVRCQGERELTYALFDGDTVRAGQRVLVTSGDSTRPGLVVITPEQLLEFHAPEPRAEARIDATPAEPPSGEAARLFKSLNLPDDAL